MTTSNDLSSQRSTLLNGCGIARDDRTRIEVSGTDRASFLHNFCTNDIKKLQPGSGCEAFFTNVQGKTIGHAFFLASDDRITIDTVARQGEFLLGHLDRYLITEDVELKDCSADHQSFLITGADVGKVAEGLNLPLPVEYCDCVNATIGDKSISVFRSNVASDSSYLISTTAQDAEMVFETLISAGATECGHDALMLARVEHGFPEFGLDITDSNFPQEVNRNTTAISFSKGCYLGQETVARLDALGHVNQVLRTVSLAITHDSAAPKTGDKILVDEKQIGWLGTVAKTPKPKTLLALAYIKVQYADPETELKTNYGTLTVR